MAANVLERESVLLTLDECLHQAARGLGRTVLVSGEAGIGKTPWWSVFSSSTSPRYAHCGAV